MTNNPNACACAASWLTSAIVLAMPIAAQAQVVVNPPIGGGADFDLAGVCASNTGVLFTTFVGDDCTDGSGLPVDQISFGPNAEIVFNRDGQATLNGQTTIGGPATFNGTTTISGPLNVSSTLNGADGTFSGQLSAGLFSANGIVSSALLVSNGANIDGTTRLQTVRIETDLIVTNGATIDFGLNRITNVATPVAASDAATRGYVDTAISGSSSSAAAAQTTANTALANAATAQTTANTGVTNAAAAQTTANTALANAAAAQGTANTALTNAATAQTTANTGVANAAAAQTTANTALTNAATAQTTANTALTNAATAQTTANTGVTNAAAAQTSANTALTQNLAQDNRLNAIDTLNATQNSRLSGAEAGISALADQIGINDRQTQGGIAAAIALGGAVIVPDSNVSVNFNLSTYRGQQGFSASFAGRVAPKTYITAGVAGSTVKGSTGARVGVAFGF